MNTFEYIGKLSEEVEDGKLNPANAYVIAYEAEKLWSEFKKSLIDQVLNQVTGSKDYTVGDYRVLESSRTTWSVKDPEIERMKTIIKTREILAKKAYKASENGQDFFDENGEIIQPAEPKTSTFIKLEKL